MTAASHFWSLAALDTGHPLLLIAALLAATGLLHLAVTVRRRRARRQLDRAWRDVTVIFHDQTDRPRADIAPLLLLLAAAGGWTGLALLAGLAVAGLLAHRRGLSVDERYLIPPPPATED